jgi:hypothetical protein
MGENIKRLNRGKSNNTDLWTLDANQGSTTFTDERIGWDSAIFFMPTTANAAAELATLYVAESGRVNGSVTVTHANDANADKIFRVAIIG